MCMSITFVKRELPIILRSDVRVKEYLKSDIWCLIPSYLSRNYQCLISDNKIIFGNYEVKDTFKINKKTENIKSQIKELFLPNDTLLIGHFYLEDFDIMTKIVTADTSTSLELQRKYKLKYIITDIIYFDGQPIGNNPYILRRELLDEIFEGVSLSQVMLTEYYSDNKDKESYFKYCEESNLSVLFVNKEKTYPESQMYRYNHPYLFNCIVTDVNIKNNIVYSLSLGMIKNGRVVSVGSATGLNYYQGAKFKEKESIVGKVVKVSSRQKCRTKLKNPKLVEVLEKVNSNTCLWKAEWIFWSAYFVEITMKW